MVALAQTAPAITPPATGTEKITCLQSNVPKTCTSLQISSVAQAATNAALTAMPSTLGSVWRLGFYAAGDAPAVQYNASGSPCSLNAGAGDSGSQVPTSDSKCWIASFSAGGADIREWGAKCDLAFDSAATVQQALNWTGNNTLILPCLIGVKSGLTIGNGNSTTASTSNQNYNIVGSAGPGIYNQFVAGDVTGPGFRYTGAGALSGPVLTIYGPIVGSLKNISIDGQYKAQTGIYAYHLTAAHNENILVAKATTTGIRLDAYPAITSVYTGGNDNYWASVFVYMSGSSGSGGGAGVSGLDIGFATGSGANLDVARNHFHTGAILVPANSGSAAITLRGTDLDTFDGIFTYSSGGASGAYGVSVQPPTGATFLPNSITFVNSPLVGGVYIGAGWTCTTGGAGEGLVFFGLPTGDMTAQGRPVPSGPCIHGMTNNGTMLDQYQPLSRKNGTQLSYSPAVLYRDFTNLVVANTVTPTTLASYTVPANAMQSTAPDNGATAWDRALLVRCTGAFKNNTGSSQTITLTTALGGTTMASTGAVTVPNSAFYASWQFETTIYAFGASNNQRTYAEARFGAISSAGGMTASPQTLTGEYSGLAVDLTSAQAATVTATLGTADANLSIVRDACSVTMF